MELAALKKHLEGIVFKEKDPFVTHREINWPKLGKLGGLFVLIVVVLLFMPTPEPQSTIFREGKEDGNEDLSANMQMSDALNHEPSATGLVYKSQGNYDYLSSPRRFSGQGFRDVDRSSSMIISRSGIDSKNQLPLGARIPVRLYQGVIVSGQPMPIIATVSDDVVQEDSVAIPDGSKVFGELSFDDNSERASVTWRSVQFPDGRERQITGIGLGIDGQLGIEGRIHSDGMKNTAGQFLSRFIGAYAEGSMQKGVLGSSDGGHANGFRNAVAETAKDRSSAYAEDLKKQRRWIEVNAGTEFLAVINQPFTFRDPGASYGQ
jgi:hypothetical protein